MYMYILYIYIYTYHVCRCCQITLKITEVSNHQLDPNCTRSFAALLSLAEGPPVAVAHGLTVQSAKLEACCSGCCSVSSAKFGLVYLPGLALSEREFLSLFKQG